MSAEGLSDFYEVRDNKLAVRYATKVRRQVYETFVRRFGKADSILDVGATNERYFPVANFLEQWFPEKAKITAAGVEDASFLTSAYPGVKFRRIEAGQPLPFADQSFDVVFSHAVIEHVTGEEDRRFFVSELLRVGKAVFLTTPNRFFPIEFHTLTPLLHLVAPGVFYRLLDAGYFGDAYRTDNLSLLSRGELSRLLASFPDWKVEWEDARLFGLSSNLIACLRREATH